MWIAVANVKYFVSILFLRFFPIKKKKCTQNKMQQEKKGEKREIEILSALTLTECIVKVLCTQVCMQWTAIVRK